MTSASVASPRRTPLARWVLRGVLLVVLPFASLNEIWSPDVVPNALLAWTLVREGDVDYDEYTKRPGRLEPPGTIGRLSDPYPGPDLDREAYFFRACGVSTATEPPQAIRSIGGPPAPGPSDRVCSIFPPGIGILALPVLVPVVLAEPLPELATLVRAGHLGAAVIEALATLLLWSVLTRFVSARWALGLILLYALGTSVRTVASQALWQHSGVHLAVAGALWLVLREGPVSRLGELTAGVLLGLGSVVRQTTALVAFGIGGLERRRLGSGFGVALRRAALASAGLLLGALPLFAWNAIAFGDPFEQGYGPKPFDTNPALGLYGLLLSPSRGLLVYGPYLAFAFAALVLAWRRPGLVASRLRGLSLVWLATLALYATYAEWWGGRVFGARFLDDQAPVLFAALAWGIGQGLLAGRAARITFWIGASWSLLLFNAAALVYSNERWDMRPENVNFAPERLFDWGDPQWLAVLGDLPSGGTRALAGAVLSALVVAVLLRLELRTAPVR